MSDWDCEHGKANNVFQHLANHDKRFHAPITIPLQDESYDIDLFAFIEMTYEAIVGEKYSFAVMLLETLGGLFYDSAVEQNEISISDEVEEFLRKLNERDGKDN